MALTFAGNRPSLGLRESNLYTPENIAAQEAGTIDASTQFGRGWQSAGLGEDANSLLSKARDAYAAGDEQGGQILEQQGRDLMARSQQWAPTVREATDIRGLGDAYNWAAGSMGNLRSSVAPFLGGLAGAGIGALAAPFTGGVINPMVGGRIGSALAGGQSEYEEAVGSAMVNPEIRATRTMGEIQNAGLVKGGVNSLLEAAVPFGLGQSLLGAGAKKAAQALAEKKLGSYVAKNVGKDMLTEGATEGTQSLTGQATENWLERKDLTDFDYKQALNEAAAGAVAGGGMGVAGAVGDVAHAKLGAATDKVKELMDKSVGDHIADAGAALGTLAGNIQGNLDEKDVLAQFNASMESISGKNRNFMDVPASESSADVLTKDSKANERAVAHAKEVLSSPEYSQGQKAAAAKFLGDEATGGHKDYTKFNTDLEGAEASDKLTRVAEDIDSKMPKKSDMGKTEHGETMSKLADLWMRQEGHKYDAFRKGGKEAQALATKMMSWMNLDYLKDEGGNYAIPHSLIEEFGTDSAHIQLSMAKLLRGQGLETNNESTVAVHKMLREKAEASAGSYGFIEEKLTPLARDNWNTAKSKNVINLLTEKKGRVSNALRKALETQFGPNTESVIKHFQKKFEVATDSLADGNNAASKRAVDPDELEYETQQEAQAVERVREGRKYVGQSKTNEYFDMNDPFHRQQVGEVIARHTQKGEDSVNRSGKRIGIVDRELEKAAEAAGTSVEELGESARNKVVAELVHKHYPKLTKVSKTTSKTTTELAKKDHAARRLRYERLLNALSVRLNKRFQTVQINEQEGDAPGINFDAATVKSLKLDRDLRDPSKTKAKVKNGGINNPKNHPQHGTIVLEHNGEPFVTTTQMLIAKMFGVRDGTSDSVAEYEGTAQMALQKVSDAITSLQATDGFSGRIGVIRNGKIVWVNDLPNDLTLFRSKGATHTVAMAKGQAAEQGLKGTREATEHEMRKMLSDMSAEATGGTLDKIKVALKAGGKVLRHTFKQLFPHYRVNVVKEDFVPEDLFSRSSDASNVPSSRAEQSLAEKNAFRKKVIEGWLERTEKTGEDVELARIVREALISESSAKIAKSYQLIKDTPAGRAISQLEKEQRQGPATTQQVGADTLADYDPKNGIVRDEAGFPDTGNLMVDGHMVVGRDTSKGKDQTSVIPAVRDQHTVKRPQEGLQGKADPVVKQTVKRKVSFDSPFSARTQMQLHKIFGAGNTKGLRGDSIEEIKKVLMSMPNLAELMGNVMHIAAALTPDILHNGKAYAVAQPLPNSDNIAILLSPKALVDLHSGNKAQLDKFARNLAHELGHSLEDLVDAKQFDRTSVVGNEAFAVTDTEMKRVLKYPLIFTDDQLSKVGTSFASELHSQVFALYQTKANVLKQRMPETFKLLEKIYGAEGSIFQYEGTVGTDSGRQERVAGSNGKSAEQRSSNESTPTKSAGSSARVERAEPAAKKQVSPEVKELQEYLKKYGAANPAWATNVREALAKNMVKQITGSLNYAKNKFDSKASNQKATSQKQASPEEVEAAKAHILKTLGNTVKTVFDPLTDDGGYGSWTPQQTLNVIKIALNGDVLGTAFHESFHEFMDILRKNNGQQTIDILNRAAMSGPMQNKLRRLLKDHPEAIKQLSNPEEAAAYMYQFWAAGALTIGPDTKTTFKTIKDILKKVASLFSEAARTANRERIKAEQEALTVEQILSAFSDGKLAEKSTRKTVVKALNAQVAEHQAAMRHLGDAWSKLSDSAGKLVFSAEAMMDATNNPNVAEIARMFHQKAGTVMKKVGSVFGGYSDGVRQQTNMYVNKLEDILMNYDKEDIELAREALSKEVTPDAIADPVVKEIVTKIREYLDEMGNYIAKRDIRRLVVDDTTGNKPFWEKVTMRKNYWPQVVDLDSFPNRIEEFVKDMLATHMDELTNLAEKANKEVAAGVGAGENSASNIQLNKKAEERTTITPEMIAQAIAMRLMNNGTVDINEDSADLGITPAARSVNRRALDWLDMTVFDKYMSKDVAHVLSGYTRTIVKRGEYQSRFGYGGEKIRDALDKAILYELGGDGLVKAAELTLDKAIDAYWAKPPGQRGSEPPTLRSHGQSLHSKDVGVEKHREALVAATKKLEQSTKAIQAMEGTLGNDISPAQRAMSSWLTTYQNFRLLSTMLFNSFADVNGIIVNGGELGDAWKAFTTGISEIKNTWMKKKSESEMLARGEAWGAVDAGSFLDSMGQAYGSMFMTGRAKELSDKFFKYTGAEGWNRGIRAVAASVAERIITEWKTEGIDPNDKASKARVERLFGKGFDVSNIKLDAEGRLDITDPLNQAAITRWMLDAVPAPTAAHRPIWGSDPHFQVFMHLKNYTYSFHRVVMKNAIEQAKLGNMRPISAVALGYMPIMIAAGAIKEMLIPGDEPPWMKGGLDGYLSYGFSRAGVLGVPQMYVDNLFNVTQVIDHPTKALDNFDPAGLFGPTTDQLQDMLSVPFMEDHSLLGEGLGSLPGGNVLRRIGR